MSPASAPQPALRPGLELDRYEVLCLLGVGGSAEVWEVRHHLLHTRHALKVLRAAEPERASRLLQEGRAQAALEHENLLPVRDTVALGEAIGLVLPLVEGPALDRLNRVYRPDPAEAAALVLAVLRGVSVIHEQGWVHRDLKPANILLDIKQERIVPRVADFGVLVTRPGAGEGHPGFFGTLAYAAPEQLLDPGRVDHKADLWALGVILYELLTGRRPFASDALDALKEGWRRGPALEGLDTGLTALLSELLSPDPARRPASCAALASRLESWTSSSALSREGPLYQAAAALRRVEPQEGEAGTLTQAPASVALPTATRDNLPPRRGRFLGREAELRALDRLVLPGLALTVLGTGGAGKTRLVLEHAAASLPRWPGGAWLCDLAEARDETGVLLAVARALEVPLSRERPAEQLGHALAARGRALFLLDNAEQVADPTARLLEAWVARAREAAFVVTSRAPLGTKGERTLELGPLALPDAEAASTAEILSSEAGALLVARAQDAKAGWTLREAEVGAAAELLVLLDGLPLAIELAAARLRLMSLPALRDRMRDRFRLLADPARGGERHGAMRAVIDWSWSLLGLHERAALSQLSVFEGGASLEAAEAVIALDADAPWVGDVLQLLMDHSLLRQVAGADEEPRFALYVSVREYAAEHLAVDPDPALDARHARFFSRLGEPDALAALFTHGGPARLEALGLELGNLMRATRQALASGEVEPAVRCWLAMSELIPRVGGEAVGGEALLRQVLALADTLPPSPDARALQAEALGRAARTLLWLAKPTEALEATERGLARLGPGESARHARLGSSRATILFDLGRVDEARAQAEASERLAAATGEFRSRAASLRLLAIITANGEHLERAIELILAAITAARASGDAAGEALNLTTMSIDLARLGRHQEAREHLEAALSRYQELRSKDGECRALHQLANNRAAQGEPEAARPLMEHALGLARRLGNRRLEAIVLTDLAEIEVAERRPGAARALNQAALALFVEQGRLRTTAVVYCNLGFIALEEGRLDEAERAFDQAVQVAQDYKYQFIAGVALRGRGALLRRRGELPGARDALIESERILRELGVPEYLALTLLERVSLERDTGDEAAAQEHLREARAIATRVNPPPGSPLGQALALSP